MSRLIREGLGSSSTTHRRQTSKNHLLLNQGYRNSLLPLLADYGVFWRASSELFARSETVKHRSLPQHRSAAQSVLCFGSCIETPCNPKRSPLSEMTCQVVRPPWSPCSRCRRECPATPHWKAPQVPPIIAAP